MTSHHHRHQNPRRRNPRKRTRPTRSCRRSNSGRSRTSTTSTVRLWPASNDAPPRELAFAHQQAARCGTVPDKDPDDVADLVMKAKRRSGETWYAEMCAKLEDKYGENPSVFLESAGESSSGSEESTGGSESGSGSDTASESASPAQALRTKAATRTPPSQGEYSVSAPGRQWSYAGSGDRVHSRRGKSTHYRRAVESLPLLHFATSLALHCCAVNTPGNVC